MKKTERKKESAQTMEEQAAVGKINGSGVRMALLYAFPKTVPIGRICVSGDGVWNLDECQWVRCILGGVKQPACVYGQSGIYRR